MKTHSWFRYLSFLTIAGAAGLAQLVSGCSGGGSSTSPGSDAGNAGDAGDAATAPDVSTTDAPHPYLSFVHDSSDMPPVTPCLVAADATVLNPSPKEIGRYGGAPLSSTAQLAPRLAEALDIYLIPSGTGHACNSKIVDYDGVDGVTKIRAVTAGTFQPDKSYVLMLLGCSGTDFVATPYCYPGWDGKDAGGGGTPGVRLEIIEVDAAQVGPGGIGVQFIQGDPHIQLGAADTHDGPAASLICFIPNMGTQFTTAPSVYAGVGSAPPVVPTKALKVAHLLDDQDVSILDLTAGTDGGEISPPSFERALSAVEQQTTGAVTYTYFQDGKNYVFITMQDGDFPPSGQGITIGLPTRW